MSVIFINPKVTMENANDAIKFHDECAKLLNQYIPGVKYVLNISQLLTERICKDDIFVFFTSEKGEYSQQLLNLLKRYNDKESRIWAVAMENTPECRRPPEPVSNKQSFDVSCRNENRNPLKNNIKAIAQIFARKIISQVLSPLYRDEVLYFISHRRIDGEIIAGKLADQLKLLTRERNIYRDVVNVAVGDDAQEDIDRNLEQSDVLIFLQTEEAKNSKYIMKEICYALLNDIPVLWIQIDDALADDLEIKPAEKPLLSYTSEDFNCKEKLVEIAEEIEEKCFQLMMNTSNQVYTYIEYLTDMDNGDSIKIQQTKNQQFAYEIQYKENSKDIYGDTIHRHYVQCFGRNPKKNDIEVFVNDMKENEFYNNNDKLFLLSSHGKRDKQIDKKICEENYDDYIANIQNVMGFHNTSKNKKIIISGAFPDCDEIYKLSLLEAVLTYAKQIIKNGYTLVFGAHPTFQKLIFDIGKLYLADIKYSIEMHMDKAYEKDYDLEELNKQCTLILSDNLQQMRENMICNNEVLAVICLGGKIKDDKSQQGVDIEVELARQAKIPVALVGTVGGRSSEYAAEMIQSGKWNNINNWGRELNEQLFYNVNHRLMSKKILDKIEIDI